MRTEPITEDIIAENRRQAAAQPATGLPELARSLLEFGWQIDRDSPAKGIPYFEEAAAIYRRLVADGAEEHLSAAMRAISSLGLQYSLAHADDLSLAAKHEAAALGRQVNAHGEGKKGTEVLAVLAHGLAESGQFDQAVAVQRDVVDIYRAIVTPDSYGLFDVLGWSLLDLAVCLDLAGQADASLEIEHEALALQRRMPEDDPRLRLPILAIWTAGASLRFASTGHPRQARELLQEAIVACDQLPAECELRNFGFLQALQVAHLARSGVQDEQPDADGAVPIGVNPDQPLQPVFGLSFHHWSFSVRHAYREGLAAINDGITARSNPLPGDPARLAELGTLVRRRNIRESVLSRFDYGVGHFLQQVIPALELGVSLERLLLAADPGRSAQRLVRALTDQAIGCLVASSNASAANILREAHDLYATTTNHMH
jgi:tetratricopeptide (TPR) repeat protein